MLCRTPSEHAQCSPQGKGANAGAAGVSFSVALNAGVICPRTRADRITMEPKKITLTDEAHALVKAHCKKLNVPVKDWVSAQLIKAITVQPTKKKFVVRSRRADEPVDMMAPPFWKKGS